MSVILVIEQDAAYANRITSVLRSAGYPAEMLASLEEASQRSVSPALVLVSGTLPGAPQILARYSRPQGGPGSVVILPVSIAGQAAPAQYHADRVLPKPFSDEELLKIVELFVPRPNLGPGAQRGQLTSEDIFGDVLAEVEAEAQVNESRRRRSRTDHSDIDRKLEETLSGFFPDKARAKAEAEAKAKAKAEAPPVAAAKPKRRRGVPSADEIEDLLDKTLSSLELPARSRRSKEADPLAALTAAAGPAAAEPSPPSGSIPQAQSPQAAPLPPAPQPTAPPPAQAPPTQPTTPTSAPPAPSFNQAPDPPAAQSVATASGAPSAVPDAALSTPGTTEAPISKVAETPQLEGLTETAEPLDRLAPGATTPVDTAAPVGMGSTVASSSPTPPAPAEAPAAPSMSFDAPAASPSVSPWGSTSFAPEPAPGAGGFSLHSDEPTSGFSAEPEHPTSFAPDSPEPPQEQRSAFDPPASEMAESPAGTKAIEVPSSFDPPPTAAPPASFDPPTFDPPASFDSPPAFEPAPSFESPPAFEPASSFGSETSTPSTSPNGGFEPPQVSSTAPSLPKDFSLGDEPAAAALAKPEHPPSFADFDTEPSPLPQPSTADVVPQTSISTGDPAPAPSFDHPSDFAPSSEPFSAGSMPAPQPEPEEQPAVDLKTPSFDEQPAAPALSDPFEPGSFSADAYGADSFAPAEEAAVEPPRDDPFSASRHGVHPTDFASAFSMPEKESPGEDSTDRLQEALDGVLQIRGDGEAPAPSDQDGTPFGDYRLLERLAVGGMAEVWRARRRGVEGFQKTVAIKKILSHLTGSSDFVTMFIDEAKLAAQLNHANIIQIYDLGKVDDDFFIAMELVDGKDLRSILNRSEELERPIPPGLALSIVAALARALDYAHRKRDFDNRALGLVHRDVSPQNVLISYEGEIKLCDFGIVKAVAKASTTQMGALKGKLQYMSPEQAWGKEVDARSDIFSLGSVLFEVLTGERLFTGDSEIGVLDAVRDCRVRAPRTLVPELPPEVDRIALKALAKTPEERYQTAGDLERDLLTVLETLKPNPGQGDLAAYLEALFQAAPAASLEAVAPSPQPTEPIQAPPSAGEPKADASAPKPQAKATTAKGGSGKAKVFLILAIILAALATIGFILYQTLGTGGGDGGSQAPVTAPAETPPSESAAPGAEAAPGTEATDPDSDAQEASPSDDHEAAAQSEDAEATAEPAQLDMKGLVDEALASERERLEADFEAERQRLEQELKKVQESSGNSSESGGSSSNN